MSVRCEFRRSVRARENYKGRKAIAEYEENIDGERRYLNI